MKLISMVAFVLNEGEFRTTSPHTDENEMQIHCYANFLNQPLTLGMFVPCDENGAFLDMPFTKDENHNYIYNIHHGQFQVIQSEYQQAKERVLFEGKHKTTEQYLITSNGSKIYRSNLRYNTIESTARRLDLTLTPNAVKQLGL